MRFVSLKKKVCLLSPGFKFHTRDGHLFQEMLVENTIGRRESEWHRIKKHSGNIFLLHVLNGNRIILNNVLLYCYGGYLSGKLFSKAYKNYLRYFDPWLVVHSYAGHFRKTCVPVLWIAHPIQICVCCRCAVTVKFLYHSTFQVCYEQRT